MQRQQHSELFTTLHQLASTFTTVFEVLADVAPEERRTEPRPAPAPEKPAPAPRPAADPPQSDACLACGGTGEDRAVRLKIGCICEKCIFTSLDDLRRQYERARLEFRARNIREHLAAFDHLITEAVDGDGAHSLPILDAELLGLLGLFRTRSGSFAAGPTPSSSGEENPGTLEVQRHRPSDGLVGMDLS